MDFTTSSSSTSSSTQSRSSYSPNLAVGDLGLDPSDPLNLLLHNSASGHSSMEEPFPEGASPPDWSQLSALWPDETGIHQKPYPDILDFSDISAFPMDIDFNPNIAIEPSALHFNPTNYNLTPSYPYDPQLPSYNDLLTTQFPFTFQTLYDSGTSSDSSPQSQRRLSVTSSESSSSVSLSPVIEPSNPATVLKYDPDAAQSPPTDTKPNYTNDPAAELAERVRQSAGVTLAVPMNGQLHAQERHQEGLSASPTTTSKLPIPRLPRHTNPSVKSSSSAASTPPPSTPSPFPITAQAPHPRTKTSHTTIERRYRTNLNARIQSLRMAVPALRVVEDRDGRKKAPNKVLVTGDPTGENVVGFGGIIDVVDERGFVDGVKVARKCSKANVLGKAVEYIRVLKKREVRLKAEQAGLKALVSGLVGGPALLKEWDREWKERFGGEEMDEVEGEMDAEADEEESDDEQDDEEEMGRKRKRGKVIPPAAAPAAKPEKKEKKEKKPTPDTTAVVPEKRKRGRPRKINPVVQPVQEGGTMEVSQTISSNEQGQAPQQYLLATFALFSFFNSPLTSTSSPGKHTYQHTGTVLNAPPYPVGSQSWGWAELFHMFHLVVSAMVLLSFILSSLGFKGMKGSWLGLIQALRKDKRSRADWIKLGEDCVLDRSKRDISIATRVQMYHHLSSTNLPSANSAATAALALYGTPGVLGALARATARAVWTSTTSTFRARPGTNLHERLVFEVLSVDEVHERLGSADIPAAEKKMGGLIRILGGALVRERMKKQLGSLFVEVVKGRVEGEDSAKVDVESGECEREQTIEAARELGGRVAELGRRFERVWKVPSDHDLNVDLNLKPEKLEQDGSIEGDVGALMKALVLYYRVFLAPGRDEKSLVSPPPSPGGSTKDADAAVLRRVLGGSVFEEQEKLEDAKDRAVDMVVALQRRSIGLK